MAREGIWKRIKLARVGYKELTILKRKISWNSHVNVDDFVQPYCFDFWSIENCLLVTKIITIPFLKEKENEKLTTQFVFFHILGDTPHIVARFLK